MTVRSLHKGGGVLPNSGFASLIDVNLNFHKGVKGWGSLTIIDFEQIMCFHYGGNGRGGGRNYQSLDWCQ